MERVSVLCLFLLCSLSGAELLNNEIIEQREASPEIVNVPEQPHPCLSDVHAVLRDLTAKLAVLQTKMDQEQTLNQEQAAKLKELENQTSEVDTIKGQLQAQGIQLMSMQAQTDVTQDQVETLRRDKEVGQLAFSASLLASGAGYIGPFNAFTPLVFRNVISNVGNAYNPNSGFFIAPVRGAYHFEFYISALGNSHHSGAVLVKNGERIVIAYETEARHWGQSANAATLLLEAGDVVSLQLWANTRVYENENRHNTFSGRLLFTV